MQLEQLRPYNALVPFPRAEKEENKQNTMARSKRMKETIIKTCSNKRENEEEHRVWVSENRVQNLTTYKNLTS